ncbi:MAG: hypothetical protein ACYDBJ_09325 [Aggregatilineales bacterium]
MIDWRPLLRSGMRGVAVEGKDDKAALEAFLDAGQKEGRWARWDSKLAIVAAEGFQKALDELEQSPGHHEIWAVLDREWRPDQELQDLQATHTRLIFLPRIMIENYAIAPDELSLLLAPAQLSRIGTAKLQQIIEMELVSWLMHGALSRVLYENGAEDFCGKTSGYPNRLLNPPHAPITRDEEITELLTQWHNQLEPQKIMRTYAQKRTEFNTAVRTDQYQFCIDGKLFFNQVVVQRILNPLLGQRKSSVWWDELFRLQNFAAPCPSDIAPILERLIGS